MILYFFISDIIFLLNNFFKTQTKESVTIILQQKKHFLLLHNLSCSPSIKQNISLFTLHLILALCF